MKKNLVRSASAFSVMAFFIAVTLVINQVQASAITTSDEEYGFRFMDNIQRSVENIDNGVVITITSDDSAIVEKIQNRSDSAIEGGGPFYEFFDVDQADVIRTVDLLDNGVQVTFTSEDADVVEKLQSWAEMDVSRTVENIENGVVITITSDDPDVVEMLQETGGKMGGHHWHGLHDE